MASSTGTRHWTWRRHTRRTTFTTTGTRGGREMADVVKPTGPSPTSSPGGTAGLRRNVLSMPEVLTQSVANAAPSAAVSVLPAIAFIYAGNGAWLTFVIATISMVLIGYSVSIFARRFASAGSFYVYNTKALGSAGGFASGWALTLGYVFTAMATTCGVAIYLGAFLTQIGLPGGTTVVILLMIAIDVAVASWFAYRSIGLSARVSLVLEAVSMTIILVLFAIVFARKGISADALALKGMPSAGIGPGIVIAIFAFVGFESAASLGLEAKNPYRTVPSSVIISAVLVGVFYIIGTLAQTTGFQGAKVGFDSAPAPLYLYRRGEPYIAPLVVGIIGSLIMLYVYYASIWPIQPMPGPLWPIIFVSWMISDSPGTSSSGRGLPT